MYLFVILNSWVFNNNPIVEQPFWKATTFQFMFMVSVFYMFTEGKLIQRMMIAKKIKQDEIQDEFKLVDKASTKVDDSILDRIRKN